MLLRHLFYQLVLYFLLLALYFLLLDLVSLFRASGAPLGARRRIYHNSMIVVAIRPPRHLRIQLAPLGRDRGPLPQRTQRTKFRLFHH